MPQVYGIVMNTINQNIDMKMFKKFLEKLGHKKAKNGKWKQFNKNAVLVSEGFYLNNLRHGRWKYFYDTGELAIEEHYLHGKLHGEYRSYHVNGSLMSEGQYANDLREGYFNVYDENHGLVKEMLFVNNILVKEEAVDQKRVPLKQA